MTFEYFLLAVQGKDIETVRLLAQQVMPEVQPLTGLGMESGHGERHRLEVTTGYAIES